MSAFTDRPVRAANPSPIHWGQSPPRRVAVVHDWLTTYAGSERVVERILHLFPRADLFTLVDFLPAADRQFLADTKITTSFLQRLPLARRHYAKYLPLMPLAIEQFDLSGYDLVISSSHCVAKGVLTAADQLHVSYVHTPMRYAWDLHHQYLSGSGLEWGLQSMLARTMLHRLRMWDARSADRVDALVANSQFVARRIKKTYRRKSLVIHPPVDVERFTPCSEKDDYYLTASRLVPYKRVDLLVEAFSQLPAKQLVVIGDGPEYARLRAKAPPNVRFLGYQNADTLCRTMQKARAFLFAAQEDFGIVLVEAQGCGTPVIALGKGGALETVRSLDHPRPSGLFFSDQSPVAVVNAIKTFEQQAGRFTAANCRASALRFSADRFDARLMAFIAARWRSMHANRVAAEQGPHPVRRAA